MDKRGEFKLHGNGTGRQKGEKVDLVAFFVQATCTNSCELLVQKGCLCKVMFTIL